MQEAGGSLFAGKTAFDEAVKADVSAAPQGSAPQSAVGTAGTGPDFGASGNQVRPISKISLLLDAHVGCWALGCLTGHACLLDLQMWGSDCRHSLLCLLKCRSSLCFEQCNCSLDAIWLCMSRQWPQRGFGIALYAMQACC